MEENSEYYNWDFGYSNGGYDKSAALRSSKILLTVDAGIKKTKIDYSYWGYNGCDFQNNKMSLVHSFICAN